MNWATIITPDYLHYALAVHDSLLKTNREPFYLYVFISCSASDFQINETRKGVTFLFIEDVCNEGLGKNIYEKYYFFNRDYFRWSMKAMLLSCLIQNFKINKVAYIDCDINYFNDPTFLFSLLDEYDLILSPHFRSSDPFAEYDNYIMQFNSGIYNGGFVAANKNAVPALEWWARSCFAICEIDPAKGQFVDQTHLNLLPVYFENVHILKHRGCNIANWNQLECKRVKQDDGTVLINNEFPVVFIHFTKSTIRGILSGEDALLLPYLEQYCERLKTYKPEIDWMLKFKKDTAPQKDSGKLVRNNFLRRFANKIKNKFS